MINLRLKVIPDALKNARTPKEINDLGLMFLDANAQKLEAWERIRNICGWEESCEEFEMDHHKKTVHLIKNESD